MDASLLLLPHALLLLLLLRPAHSTRQKPQGPRQRVRNFPRSSFKVSSLQVFAWLPFLMHISTKNIVLHISHLNETQDTSVGLLTAVRSYAPWQRLAAPHVADCLQSPLCAMTCCLSS